MAGQDSGRGPAGGRRWQWDVVLSFAGAQREYVEQVAQALQTQEIRCFYDADEQIELWGKYLAEELPTIYGERAATAVVFVSADYAARDWTRLERRAALNRAVRERQEYVLPARFDGTPLPGLLSDMVAVDLRTRTPQQFAGMIASKLAALGITRPPPDSGETLSSGTGVTRPPGAVRVAEADLRRLGVHAAISMPGVSDEVPPEYVPRDTDTDEHGVRAKVAVAAERGGFMLLTGSSSVGKTRCAAEAVKALLPDWWLIHPAAPAEVATLAAAPPARIVIWLDELQRYLDGDHDLAAGTIRALLNAPGPVVIIATLWPDRYAAYTAVPAPGGADPHAREREVLDLAAVIRIRPEFSAAEQARARDAATRDLRLAAAVEAEGYGLTQTLAAAPQLVARWEDAQELNPYAWAVMTAALDASRLGARTPLTGDFLRAAAPGYCTTARQARAPANWFEQALAYATAELHGATAALVPSGTGMGRIDGYTAADYLIQHATRERRFARVPASTWDAILSHVRDCADTARIARSAAGRLLYRYAIPLYRPAADAGDRPAAIRLADILADRGDLDELRARADNGDQPAAMRLARLLANRGDLDELRARADNGDQPAAERLADILAGRGDLDELRARADNGDQPAAMRLAGLQTAVKKLGEVPPILRHGADAGNQYAADRLAGLLADRGDLDGLRALADNGDHSAAERLARLLADRGDLDELRTRAGADMSTASVYAALRLAELLADRGDLDELRTHAGAGIGANMNMSMASMFAAVRLNDLLADRGDLDELRTRAGAGADPDANDHSAAMRLAELLAERGDVDELRARADAGDPYAAKRLADRLAKDDIEQALQILHTSADAGNGDIQRLAELLTQQGRKEDAERLRRFGLNPDGSIASR